MSADGPPFGDRSALPGAPAQGIDRAWELTRAILVSARPRQWIKNAIVFIPPAAAGVLLQGPALESAAKAFLAFCLLSSAAYLVNDVRDREGDRLHPRKRLRPVAAGRLPPGLAVAAAATSAAMAVGLALLAGPALATVALVYLGTTVGYSLGLKRIPVLEILLVAGGFVLRGLAGGTATAVPLSAWFLAVISCSALVVVIGKRYAERAAPGRGRTRAVLSHYSHAGLRTAAVAAGLAAIVVYGLWATGPRIDHDEFPWASVSLVPFALGILRYLAALRAGGGEAPEALLYEDRWLQVVAAAWIVTFALAATSIR